jgi:hypothetical protein
MDGQEISISGSVGINLYPEDGEVRLEICCAMLTQTCTSKKDKVNRISNFSHDMG